jgi:hypothetical protein
MESNAEPEEETVNDPGDGESRSIEVRLSAIWWAAGVLVVAIAIGVGAYAYGKSTVEDLDASRTQCTESGQRKVAASGSADGYAAGFKKGREAGFERTYPKAYRKSYAEAFEEAGLEVPAPQDIPVSSP